MNIMQVVVDQFPENAYSCSLGIKVREPLDGSWHIKCVLTSAWVQMKQTDCLLERCPNCMLELDNDNKLESGNVEL